MQIEITPVTAKNRETAENLKVARGQEGYVETVAECLREADKIPCWRPVLLSVDGEPVGFAMYGFWEKEYPGGRVWLDRLLIDGGSQGMGCGKAALTALLSRLEWEHPGRPVYLSVYPENQAAIRLYTQFGFAFNGEKDIHGEDVMVRPPSGGASS